MKKINLVDITLTENNNLDVQKAIEIVNALIRMKISIIEVFAARSFQDFEIAKTIAQFKEISVCSLSRAVFSDIDQAAKAFESTKNQSIINIFMDVSESEDYKLKNGPDRILSTIIKSIEYAKKFFNKIEFSATYATATNTDIDFLKLVISETIKAGIEIFNIVDSDGKILPNKFETLISNIKTVPDIKTIKLSTRCNNQSGLAIDNSLIAIKYGSQIECNLVGTKTPLKELISAIKTQSELYTDCIIND